MIDERLTRIGFRELTAARGAAFFHVTNDTTWVKDLFAPNITILYDTDGGTARIWDNHERRWMMHGNLTLDELEDLMDQSVNPVVERLTELVDKSKLKRL